jgi:hypothetical protein
MAKAKQITSWVLLGAVYLLAFALMTRVRDALGLPAVGAIGSAAALGAWLAHTERSAIFAEMFRRALSDCGIPMKEAAAVMGCSYSVLS